jgi:hypothetical protein
MIRRRRKNLQDTRIKGHSYARSWYEDAVGAILGQIGRVDDMTITEVVRLHASHAPRADELTLARISRSREDAARQLAKARDLAAWQAAMARLDPEETVARRPIEPHRLSPAEIVDYSRSLPRLWADSGPDGRRALVGAISPRWTSWGSSGSSTSSCRTQSTLDSTRRSRPSLNSKARLVSLVGPRGVRTTISMHRA